MSAWYTIVAAEDRGLTKPGQHGQFQRFNCTLRNAEGNQLTDVYWQRKPGSEVNPGDQVFGTVSQGQYGPRFKMDPNKPDGAPPPTNDAVRGPQTGSPSVPPPGPTQAAAAPGTLDPQQERSRRIERQHSQEMAIRAMALGLPGITATLDDLRKLTDWFVRDLNSPVPAPSSETKGGAVDNQTAASPASLEDKVKDLPPDLSMGQYDESF